MRLFSLAICFVLLLPIAAFVGLDWLAGTVGGRPSAEGLEDYRPLLSSRVLDRNGKPVAEFFEERRRALRVESLPDHVIGAFVAAEDARFFEHGGIDPVAVLRAIWVNLRNGHVRQGASTITQQTVKNLLLTPERTFERKLAEWVLAIELEGLLGKQDILELYLNEIYLGSGAHGLSEAAWEYFGKEAPDLSVSEAALLAGLPPRPSGYSPRNNPEAAEERRLYVLGRMRESGWIDLPTYVSARMHRPVLRERHAAEDGASAVGWFVDEVRRSLAPHFGESALRREGLTIETTLDVELQTAAVRALRRGLEEIDVRQDFRGPIAHLDSADLGAGIRRLAAKNGIGDSLALDALPDRVMQAVVVRTDERIEVVLGPGVQGPLEIPTMGRRGIRLEVGDVVLVRPSPAGAGSASLRLTQDPSVEGALASIDADTGEVLALVGGYEFGRSYFNRATQARRPPGSAFKPFVYGAALERGWSPSALLLDRPFLSNGWAPRNHGRRFLGQITLREALSRSVNNASVHLLNQVGIDATIDFARRMGIESPLRRDLTLALGTSRVSLLELTGAYATLAAGGYHQTPHCVRRVLDRDGNVLWAWEPEPPLAPLAPTRLAASAGPVVFPATAALPAVSAPPPDAVALAAAAAVESDLSREAERAPGAVSAEVAFVLGDLLHGAVADSGATGWRAGTLPFFVAGKTGTTNDRRDAWFVGYSASLASGVWVGYDRSRRLGRGESGGTSALPVWREYMAHAALERDPGELVVPEGIVFRWIDADTGMLADSSTRRSHRQAFVPGTEPRRVARRETERREWQRRIELADF